MTGPRPIESRALDLVGMILFILGLVATAEYFGSRVSTYDEGGLLTNAFLLEQGALHYRDFYSSYPPGISVLILLTWKVLGVSVTAPRILGFVFHIALAAGAGRLAGRASGRRFSWLAAGLVALWLSALGVVPLAWLAALAAGFWALDAMVTWSDRGTRGSAFLTGALLGLVSVLRHDLLVYLVLAISPAALWWITHYQRRARLWAALPWIVTGFALVWAPVWLPAFVGAGIGRVAQDLYFDQVRHVVPGRNLPIGSPGPVPPTLWFTTIAIGLIAPLLAAGLAFGARRHTTQLTASLLLLALSLAVLPQMLGRSEWAHFLETVVPGLCGVAILLERGAALGTRQGFSMVAASTTMLMIVGWPLLPSPAKWVKPRLDFARRESGMPAWQYDAKRDVVEFITRHSQPGEPIFVGNAQHRRVTYNDLSLYYLAARPGATRHMQFDPGLTTSEEVQREMIRELETRGPRVVVLLEGGYVPEPNQSSIEGSPLLDAYLKARYRVVDSTKDYRMLLRD